MLSTDDPTLIDLPASIMLGDSGFVTLDVKTQNAAYIAKTVHLTAKLTYKSSLGGVPTVKTFHITAKGKKPKHK